MVRRVSYGKKIKRSILKSGRKSIKTGRVVPKLRMPRTKRLKY